MVYTSYRVISKPIYQFKMQLQPIKLGTGTGHALHRSGIVCCQLINKNVISSYRKWQTIEG